MIEYVLSWLTPTVLFCVVNLVILTLFISSSFAQRDEKQSQQLGDDNSAQLGRVPSLFDRVSSLNYSFRRDNNPVVFDPFSPPSLLQRVKTLRFSMSRRSDDYSGQIPAENETRNNNPSDRVGSTEFLDSRSDPDPIKTRIESTEFLLSRSEISISSSERPDPDPILTRISGEKTRFAEVESVESEPRRSKSATCADFAAEEEPDFAATVRDRKWKSGSYEEEDYETVDSKADDFINRFKQQLKMQRLDSLLRYKQALHSRIGT